MDRKGLMLDEFFDYPDGDKLIDVMLEEGELI